MAISNYEKEFQNDAINSGKNLDKLVFSNKYLIVMVVRTSSNDYIKMWSLTIKAERAVQIVQEGWCLLFQLKIFIRIKY